jgi:hypothetical protein
MYAGYFLVLLLALLFCMCCRFWTASKVNYVFIFEFDTRHHLDWRQLCEVSRCAFLSLDVSNGLTVAMLLHFPPGLVPVAKLYALRRRRHVSVLSCHLDWIISAHSLFACSYLIS